MEGIYYTFNIALVSLSIASSILVLKVHFRGHKKERVPDFLKKFLLMPLNTHLNRPLNSNGLQMNNKNRKETRLININENESIINLLSKILKSTKTTNKLLMNEKIQLYKIEQIRTEWKEAARRIDRLLFFLSVSIVTSVPIILFSKYLFKEPTKLNDSCRCN